MMMTRKIMIMLDICPRIYRQEQQQEVLNHRAVVETTTTVNLLRHPCNIFELQLNHYKAVFLVL